MKPFRFPGAVLAMVRIATLPALGQTTIAKTEPASFRNLAIVATATYTRPDVPLNFLSDGAIPMNQPYRGTRSPARNRARSRRP